MPSEETVGSESSPFVICVAGPAVGAPELGSVTDALKIPSELPVAESNRSKRTVVPAGESVGVRSLSAVLSMLGVASRLRSVRLLPSDRMAMTCVAKPPGAVEGKPVRSKTIQCPSADTRGSMSFWPLGGEVSACGFVPAGLTAKICVVVGAFIPAPVV